MARPRTPKSQLNPDSLEHNKGRYAARVLDSKPVGALGRPSKWLTAEEKKIWRALVRSAPAVLGENDRTLMEITVCLKAKLEERKLNNQQMTQLLNCLLKLQIIPREREAVPEKKPLQIDEWDQLDQPS
jgi:hypothetical protein